MTDRRMMVNVAVALLVAGCDREVERASSVSSSLPAVTISASRASPRGGADVGVPEPRPSARRAPIPIQPPTPHPLDLSIVSAPERKALEVLVSTVLEDLQRRRYAALASVVHPESGLTIEHPSSHVARQDLARLGAQAMAKFRVCCHDDEMTLDSYIRSVALGGLDYTKPRPIHYDRVPLRDAASRMEGVLPRIVVEVTDRENELGWVHQLVLYVDRYKGRWYLAGIYTTDHHACG